MGVDGFSMSSLGLPKDITSAQATASMSENVVLGNTDKNVEKINQTINKKITDDEEKKNKGNFFNDGFAEKQEEEDDDDDENSKDENDDEKSSSSKPKYKAPVINDPENVVIRFNGNTQKIELYNQVSQKTIESIKANDFVSMINKLDNNSGILVNKKI